MINSQYTVKTAQCFLVDPRCSEDRQTEMRMWTKQVVGAPFPWKIQCISEYYNQFNKINPFKPTWASNVVHVRNIWVEIGRPNHIRKNTRDDTGLDEWNLFLRSMAQTLSNVPTGKEKGLLSEDLLPKNVFNDMKNKFAILSTSVDAGTSGLSCLRSTQRESFVVQNQDSY